MHALLPCHRGWRCKKGLVSGNSFADGLLFEIISSLALTGREYDLAPEGVLFREIRSFVSLNFISFKVSFCSRLCNKVGHVLASMDAKQTMPRCRWVDSAPNDVCDLVASELTEPV
jgi:hypothetical protein